MLPFCSTPPFLSSAEKHQQLQLPNSWRRTELVGEVLVSFSLNHQPLMAIVLGFKLETTIPVWPKPLVQPVSSPETLLASSLDAEIKSCWQRSRAKQGFGIENGSRSTARRRECWKEDSWRGLNFTLHHASSTMWGWRWTDPVSKLLGDRRWSNIEMHEFYLYQWSKKYLLYLQSDKQFSGASVLSIIYTCFLACYNVSVSKIQVYTVFFTQIQAKILAWRLFDANKNCLPKDKRQRNENFPVSPDSCQADCVSQKLLFLTHFCASFTKT